MVLRAAGEIGCAHCHTVGAAEQTCRVCRLQVCDRCAADWSTCDQPSGRVVRLGLTARVRDIDPLGRLALVSHWRKPLRIFDLRTLTWRPGELSRVLYLLTRPYPPRLTSDERLVHAEVIAVTDTGNLFVALRSRSLASGSDIKLAHSGAPLGLTGVSAQRDVYWYVNHEQKIAVVSRPPLDALPASTSSVALAPHHVDELRASTCFTYEPLPRKVMQAVHVDGERQLLACASWSELALHRMDAGKLSRLGHVDTALQGDVLWIGVAGPYLAAVVFQGARGTHVEVRRLGENLTVDRVTSFRTPPRRGFSTAAISRDGRYLAVAWDASLDVHDLDAGTHETFDEHTERINAVRFAADDHVLISADTDNRLILRPRTPTGHARPLIAIEPTAQ